MKKKSQWSVNRVWTVWALLVFIFFNASSSLSESPILLRNVRVLWFDASNPIPVVSENLAEVASVFPPCSFSIELVLQSTFFREMLQNCLVVPAVSICGKFSPKFCWSSATVSFNKHLRKRWGFSAIKKFLSLPAIQSNDPWGSSTDQASSFSHSSRCTPVSSMWWR